MGTSGPLGRAGRIDAVSGQSWGLPPINPRFSAAGGPSWSLLRAVCIQAPTDGAAGAVGDPHLQNVRGERFDVVVEGDHILINIPRGLSAENALLRVVAGARRLGGHCADMYFEHFNVTGSWAEAKRFGGFQYSASQGVAMNPQWATFGNVELKVVHGRTESGIRYLNLYAKHLGRAGFDVGGLPGEEKTTSWTTTSSLSTQSTTLSSKVCWEWTTTVQQ